MADPQAEVASMIANLEARTGKSLDDWLALARGSGQAKHGALVSWLKSAHGLTHGYANLVAHKAFASDAGSSGEAELMEAMFAGPKAAMKPAYDKVAAIVSELGGAEFAPKKGYVSFRRNKQFGLAQPSTSASISSAEAIRTRWVTMAFHDPDASSRPDGSTPFRVRPRSSRSLVEGCARPNCLLRRKLT